MCCRYQLRLNNQYQQATCRDLWTLNLALLPNPPPPEPYVAKDGEFPDNDAEQDTDAIVDSIAGVTIQSDNEAEGSGSSSEQSSDSDGEDEDEDLRDMMRAASEAPNIVDGTEAVPRVYIRSERRKLKRKRHGYDSPAANIAVLVVSCWWLRIPVTYMDFVRWFKLFVCEMCSS